MVPDGLELVASALAPYQLFCIKRTPFKKTPKRSQRNLANSLPSTANTTGSHCNLAKNNEQKFTTALPAAPSVCNQHAANPGVRRVEKAGEEIRVATHRLGHNTQLHYLELVHNCVLSNVQLSNLNLQCSTSSKSERLNAAGFIPGTRCDSQPGHSQPRAEAAVQLQATSLAVPASTELVGFTDVYAVVCCLLS